MMTSGRKKYLLGLLVIVLIAAAIYFFWARHLKIGDDKYQKVSLLNSNLSRLSF